MATEAKFAKADDYLLTLTEGSAAGWLKHLVEEVILARGTPSKSALDRAYQLLLAANKLRASIAKEALPPKATDAAPGQSADDFSLLSLEHNNGVNALEIGTKLPFHPKLTVVYGKNGSGKSGFVRILKRISGSRSQEDIWQNVHSAKTRNRCSARVEYVNSGNITTLDWNGEKAVPPFNRIDVFDGRCVPIYLNDSLSFSYEPYGFELFPALSSAFKGLQDRITADIRTVERGKPIIDGIFDDETQIGKFVSKISPTTTLSDLDKLPKWGGKARKNLVTLQKRLKGLENLDDQLELLRTRDQKLEALEEALGSASDSLSAKQLGVYAALLRRFNALKKKKAAQKQVTFDEYEIPGADSDEWQSFIDAGEAYIQEHELHTYPSTGQQCIYCRQSLSSAAVKLIKLYRALFEEQETVDLDGVEAELTQIIEEIRVSSFVDECPYKAEEYTKLLPKSAVDLAFAALSSADALSEKLAAMLEKRKLEKLQPPKLAGVRGRIRKARSKIETEISTIEEARRNAAKKARELESAIAELEDVKRLSIQRPQLKKYIEAIRWVKAAAALQSTALGTKAITDLGKRAWKELISDTFSKRFHAEALGLSAPPINLAFRGEYGAQMREKRFEGLGSIGQFLSEGEQKAVALADFFAELSMQSERVPAVFDDPATSFDHERKELIAKRIALEAGTRQVIVFTHDLMFASYLHEQVEKDDSGIDQAKASFHDLRKERDHAGLVTEDYYPGSVKFDAYMKRIDSKVRELDSVAGDKAAEAITGIYSMLRRAVEKAVEERIFGKVITRWSDQIQMHNVARATLDREKLSKAKELHELFSRYIEAHNQSDEMKQHNQPDPVQLKVHVLAVKELAVR